jgi:hypothetical protein
MQRSPRAPYFSRVLPRINSSQFPDRKMDRKTALINVVAFEFLRSCITAPAQRHTRPELRPFSNGSSRIVVSQVSDVCHSTSRILPQQLTKGITGRKSPAASPCSRPSHNRTALRDSLTARSACSWAHSTSGRWFVVAFHSSNNFSSPDLSLISNADPCTSINCRLLKFANTRVTVSRDAPIISAISS